MRGKTEIELWRETFQAETFDVMLPGGVDEQYAPFLTDQIGIFKVELVVAHDLGLQTR